MIRPSASVHRRVAMISAGVVDRVCVTDVAWVCMSGAAWAETVTWPLVLTSPSETAVTTVLPPFLDDVSSYHFKNKYFFILPSFLFYFTLYESSRRILTSSLTEKHLLTNVITSSKQGY